jgi:ribosomal RNA-processing protein 17
MGPQVKRRKVASAVEEISFDPTARHDFLTGFHKRKQQRIKLAQEYAEKKAREEKREERRKVWYIYVLYVRFGHRDANLFFLFCQ